MKRPVPPVPYPDVVKLLLARVDAPVTADVVAKGYGLDINLAQRAIDDADRLRHGQRRHR